ncbi:unnamed protein product [Lactuca saligna]|uniref:WRKY domain-containing protein n=1 Tax=Lactuca saligna TaxID=75948 RepID=A0AA35ZYZ5_LACSI|nr:unnamed protein product [Lactuca saligna]
MEDSIINVSNHTPDVQASKKRQAAEKIVVTVKLEENEGKKRSENASCDCWSWRKYGQKPIKGSPYPRGYYRCSTSKSCSAKKQVELCRTDASMLIITYTSTHNHPDPTLPKKPKTKILLHDSISETNTAPDQLDQENENQKQVTTIAVEDEDATTCTENDNFHYIQTPEDETRLTLNLENTFFDEEPLSYPNLMTFSAPKTEENDFYDELEELPMSSSSFKIFMRSNFFEERVLVQPP